MAIIDQAAMRPSIRNISLKLLSEIRLIAKVKDVINRTGKYSNQNFFLAIRPLGENKSRNIEKFIIRNYAKGSFFHIVKISKYLKK